MSSSFNDYLKDQPIHVFKMVDGSTVIANLIEDAGDEVYISKPQEISLCELNKKGHVEILLNEWLFGTDAEDVIIHSDKIITHSPATAKMKNFYSKCLIQTKISKLAKELNLKKSMKKDLHPFDLFQSFIDGLEPKDTFEEEYSEEPFNYEEYNKRRWEWPSDLD
tara:strand:+ start:4322 stop:4816 length:495 start_codon:yes stop_codon:yes gene_type:complete